MSKSVAPPPIRLRGVRQNNLKGFDLDLPQNRLIVLTGLSGSGKSSLAFETLFAEGQRRYIETFSPYARQFFDRMDKPRVDSIEGIPPAIAIEQRNAVRSTRSTVGTLTEMGDYLKVLWPHLATLHCQGCGQRVTRDAPQAVWSAALRTWRGSAEDPAAAPTRPAGAASPAGAAPEVLISFSVPLTPKLSLAESLAFLEKQGYQRLLVRGQVVRVSEWPAATTELGATLTVIQDRLRLTPAHRSRFLEGCEQAYHFGKGRLTLHRLSAAGDPLASEPAGHPLNPAGPPPAAPARLAFSNRLHCPTCDLEYREPTPALFSFNHPLGACPTCRGFGRTIEIDYRRAVPDRSKTLAGGAVKPWQSGLSAECQGDLRKFCRARGVPMDVPFAALSAEHQRWVLEGDPDYGTDAEHEWPRAWYGVKGYFRWLESKAYKMHVRVLLSRYRAYVPCPGCQGRRLRPEALLYRIGIPEALRPTWAPAAQTAGTDPRPPEPSLHLADFYALPLRDAFALVDGWFQDRARRRRRDAVPGPGGSGSASAPARGPADPVALALEEVRARLGYLVEVGLGYLTLDRPTRTLSGGETERVNLTTCLGSRLVNTLFVLDEPSVGLHPCDTRRLIRLLARLRDAGNTVVVVEHEASVMEAADVIVDLGPGHGETGGQLVFQGTLRELLHTPASLTGQYLSGRRRIELPPRRPVLGSRAAEQGPKAPVRGSNAPAGGSQESAPSWLSLRGVYRHNLRHLDVEIPLGRLVVVSGVSGSGKTTLLREVLFPALEARLRSAPAAAAERRNTPDPAAAPEAGTDPEPEEDADESVGPVGLTDLHGWEALGRAILVDQAPLGRTPRSNPAVYIGAFEDLRDLFAASEIARERGLAASAFSFNSRLGQCERCRGAGFERIEMQFLSDVFIRCPDCDGRRYRAHVLECRLASPAPADGKTGPGRATGNAPRAAWSIADVLEASVEGVLDWLTGFAESRPARRASARLELLRSVGLGYLRLGQAINTLSGGESQRLKLAAHLAEAIELSPAETPPPPGTHPDASARRDRARAKPTLFLFDEPTTGLHFEDVRVLLEVFQRLVQAGHSVVVIEHNLEVIKCADWVLELGPGAGDEGGQLVVAGTPEAVAACPASPTGQALQEVLAPPAKALSPGQANRAQTLRKAVPTPTAPGAAPRSRTARPARRRR